jgi:biotin transport system substrate-specific component
MDKRRSLLATVSVALFAAIIAAGAFIAVPIGPVPIVLQNLFALLAGLLLGPWLGSAAVAAYLAIGAIGAPIFAGGKGGFAHLMGPTGGFLLGYLLAALAAGLIAGKPRADKAAPLWRIALAVVVGMAIVYLPGVPRLKAVLNFEWPKAFAIGCLPFLIGDAVKAAAAVIVAPRLRRAAADLLHG